MYCLDTKEEVDIELFFNGLENGEIVVINREWTEEEKEELRTEIKKRKAMLLEESKIEEPAFA
jgi:hypothetical protein